MWWWPAAGAHAAPISVMSAAIFRPHHNPRPASQDPHPDPTTTTTTTTTTTIRHHHPSTIRHHQSQWRLAPPATTPAGSVRRVLKPPSPLLLLPDRPQPGSPPVSAHSLKGRRPMTTSITSADRTPSGAPYPPSRTPSTAWSRRIAYCSPLEEVFFQDFSLDVSFGFVCTDSIYMSVRRADAQLSQSKTSLH